MEDADIIGFVNDGQEREGDTEYTGEVYALYVLQPFQGQGIGRTLIQQAMTELQVRGYPSVLVWALADNPAHRFYERMGGPWLQTQTIEIGGITLIEDAYGWRRGIDEESRSNRS